MAGFVNDDIEYYRGNEMSKTMQAVKLVFEKNMSIHGAAKQVGLRGASSVSKAVSRIKKAKTTGTWCECCNRRLPTPKTT